MSQMRFSRTGRCLRARYRSWLAEWRNFAFALPSKRKIASPRPRRPGVFNLWVVCTGDLEMDQLLQAAAEYYVITVLGGCAVLGMVLKSFTMVLTGASRERSRREIAAYIAEGSITPDQGERLMRAEVNGMQRAA
jgi:hypothetical protein